MIEPARDWASPPVNWVSFHEHREADSWLATKRRMIDPASHLQAAIDESREILDLPHDWDEAGSPAYKEETWKRAINLLRAHALALFARTGVLLPTPRILPGPHGSIDLHWKTARREALMNIPEGLGEPTTYYGDDFGSDQREGVIEPEALEMELFLWLTVTD